MALFDEQVSRTPDHYPWTDKFIDAIQENPWSHKEFTFQSDVHDFKVKMDESEKQMVVRSLSSIAQVELPVKKFWVRLGDVLPHPSITDMGHVFGGNEVVHGRAYFRLLQVLGLEDEFEKNVTSKTLGDRVKYLRKHSNRHFDDDKQQYIYSLILFTLFVENVSLFSQFYVILWLGRFKNFLKDTNQQVFYTCKEENIHKDAGIMLIKTLRKEYPELFDEKMDALVDKGCRAALKAQVENNHWIVGDYKGERISAAHLDDLVKRRFNDSFKSIGYKPIFEVDKELARDLEWFDEEILGNNKVDFFHQRPVDYSKNSISFAPEELF